MEEEARNYIGIARQLSFNEDYSQAFDVYVLAFETCPSIKERFRHEFRLVLNNLNIILSQFNRYDQLFANYSKVLSLYPNNVYMLNDLGKYLYKAGYFTEAWGHFQKALNLDAGFVNAEKNLNSVKNMLMDRWHFRMLNDKIRNEAYRTAIRETIVPFKDNILDIGTGTGLLAIYANECFPTATTGCDSCTVMTQLAESILEENRIANVIIVNKTSMDLTETEIGGERSVLVTELFDAALFGEHVLQAIGHAKEHLLTVDAKVIPNKAEFFIMGIKSDHLSKRYKLSPTAMNFLSIPDVVNIHIFNSDSTYDCEDVHLYKDVRYMTEPQSLIKIDFNDAIDIEEKLERTDPYSVELKAINDGKIDIWVGWFNLYLTENVTLTTDPRAENRASAWQQAVFYDNITQNVVKDETVQASFHLNGGKIKMVNSNNAKIERISVEMLRFLNDAEYMGMIKNCIGMASVYLGQMVEMSQVEMVDLCPFPYFGFLMLKRGAQSLTCCAKTEYDMKFIKKVFKANKIPTSKLKVLLGNEWNQEVFRDLKYYAVYGHIFDICGEIDFQMLSIVQHLRNFHLHQGGLLMPSHVYMVSQLVESHWLDTNNRVYDENVSNYRMSMHVNKYQVSQNFCIDFSCLEYTALTEPAVISDCSRGFSAGVVNVPVVRDGDCNAILCWYEIELMDNIRLVSTNRMNSFMDGTVFLANPSVQVKAGDMANILRCVDSDSQFKLILDVEN